MLINFKLKMSDNECDTHDTFGVVKCYEQEVAIQFDDEFDAYDSFYNKENIIQHFVEGFDSNATRQQLLKMENADFIFQENGASNWSLNKIKQIDKLTI